jgi:hypothetical protein
VAVQLNHLVGMELPEASLEDLLVHTGETMVWLTTASQASISEPVRACRPLRPSAADSTAVVDVNVFRSYSHLTNDSSINNYNDPRQVAKVRNAIDTSLPQDAFLRQIVHTLLLLYGKDKFGADKEGVCAVATECRTCAPGLLLRPKLFA